MKFIGCPQTTQVACRKLSGLSDDDVEKLTEDFDDAQDDASTSD